MLRDWLDDRGGYNGLEDDAFSVRAILSMMGDGRSGGSGTFRFSLSDQFGFGNLRFVDLDSQTGSAGMWGTGRTWMQEGSVLQYHVNGPGAESTALTGWKFVALIDEGQWSGSPDIRYELVDTCPSGGGEQIILTATRHALRARMRVPQWRATQDLHGRCLVVRATVEHAADPFYLYTADYTYSNTRSNHAAD